jgi:hemerythrin superfamily protein
MQPSDQRPAESATADIFELLRRDHQNVRALLDEIEGAEDDGQREGLFAQLVLEVEAHSQAEDDVFYTSIAGALTDKIDDARHEHDEVESMLEEQGGIPVSDHDWLDKLREIRHLIEHHIDEEETIVFPLAREALGEEEALRLGVEFLHARRMVTEELSSDRLVADSSTDSTATFAQMTSMVDVTADFDQLSKTELYDLARQRRIEGRSAMTRAELVDALRSAR